MKSLKREHRHFDGAPVLPRLKSESADEQQA